VLPSRHGITDFITRSDGVSVPVTGNLRRVPALWDLSLTAEYTVAFVDWYVTWPAEPVRGLLVSDRVDYDGLDRRVFPESFTAAVDSARVRVDARADRDAARFLDGGEKNEAWRDRQWGQVRRSLRVLDEIVRHDLVTMEVARTALREGQPDLTALYFRGNDNTQHLFWKYRLTYAIGAATQELFSELEPEDTKYLAPVIDRYYDFADRLLGEALSLLEPDTAVLVVSDHGFLTKNEVGPWTHGNAFLAELGLAVLAPGNGGDADSAASSIYDESGPSTDAVRMFRPGKGGEAVALERIREQIVGARTETGASVFKRIYPGEDDRGPFLRVEFRGHIDGDSCRVGERTFPVDRFRTREAKSGDHRMNGVLIAAGSPFRRAARVEGARAVDIAPTVLHLLGAAPAEDMEGVVLVDLLDPSWRDAHPIRYVDTYGVRDEIDGDAISSEADERIREELRALGYIQ
jgi:predicted AlkP superfamily phosphohydrolase/phosphomutase